MADKKISALTAASTPLAGTEVLPIVQSGATVKVAVSDLTAGRTVAASRLDTSNSDGGGVMATFTSGWSNTLVTIKGDGATGAGVMNISNAAASAALPYQLQLNGTKVLGADTSGNVDVTVGNLVIGTSGKGIDFSATPGTGTSELLADYEEGDWTPVPVPTSGAITTYTSTGIYTKVGRQVTLTFNITISNAGTATALSSITGIPFTNGGVVAPGCGREAGVTGAMWQYTIAASATSIVGRSYANDPSIVSGYILYGSVTYTV